MALEIRNVVGSVLQSCSTNPLTGWNRDGCCRSGAGDSGVHVVCVRVSAEFLAFSKSRGNDLTTPRPEYAFPGLEAGDRWCLVAMRWAEAHEAGMAPRLHLRSTHISVLQAIPLDVLKKYALDLT